MVQRQLRWVDAVMKTVVTISDQPYEITVYQKSRTVWIAVGDYMGKKIERKARSARSAASHWRAAARYRGTDISLTKA